jgi:heat shock protein HslJ
MKIVFVLVSIFSIAVYAGAEGKYEVDKTMPPVIQTPAGNSFDSVKNKEWSLVELRTVSGNRILNRQTLEADGMGDAFTLQFDNDRLSGKGVPNRYFGPYQTGSGNSLVVGNVASTLMAAFKELDALKEREYFAFLGKVTGWSLEEDKLLLASKDASGQDAALVYTASAGISFDLVKSREWLLAEVQTVSGNRELNRQTLEADGMGDAFTLQFADDRLSGKGVPNRYFGPYQTGEKNSISIANIASTQMASFKEPDALKEYEYFRFLSRAAYWSIKDGKLLLYSKDENGLELVLVYTAK